METVRIFAVDCPAPCTIIKFSRDMAEVRFPASASKNGDADILGFTSVYTLNADGMVNGRTSLKSTSSHKIRNVF